MSERKLWKIISITDKGSRISKNVPYGEAMKRFHKYQKDLKEGDILYMVQVLEMSVGRAALPVIEEEIEITAPTFLGAAAR